MTLGKLQLVTVFSACCTNNLNNAFEGDNAKRPELRRTRNWKGRVCPTDIGMEARHMHDSSQLVLVVRLSTHHLFLFNVSPSRIHLSHVSKLVTLGVDRPRRTNL